MFALVRFCSSGRYGPDPMILSSMNPLIIRTIRTSALIVSLWSAIGLIAQGSTPPKGEPTNAREADALKAAANAKIDARYQELVAMLPPEQQAWERVLQSQLGSF